MEHESEVGKQSCSLTGFVARDYVVELDGALPAPLTVDLQADLRLLLEAADGRVYWPLRKWRGAIVSRGRYAAAPGHLRAGGHQEGEKNDGSLAGPERSGRGAKPWGQ